MLGWQKTSYQGSIATNYSHQCAADAQVSEARGQFPKNEGLESSVFKDMTPKLLRFNLHCIRAYR